MAMTDRSILIWVREILGVGTVGEKRSLKLDILKLGKNNGVGVCYIMALYQNH